tara:strand:+ start:933 stop:1451 length:519 start_codon:yes stop_codon:yes gene_type:complete
MARDYKDEYEKFQKHKSAYRAKLNAENRKRGTYGNGDGKDLSHKDGGFVQEDESINRGRKEKSRLKGSKRKAQEGGLLVGKSHEEGGIPIEAEGGEVIINTSVNGAADMHEEELLELNKNPQDYEIIHKNELASHGGVVEKNASNRGLIEAIEYIETHGDIPFRDARNRSKK